jgi:hypothetical protein
LAKSTSAAAVLIAIPLFFVGLLSTSYAASAIGFTAVRNAVVSLIGAPSIITLSPGSSAGLVAVPPITLDLPTLVGVFEMAAGIVWLVWLARHWD